MAGKILVVTPHPALGETISRSLEEGNRYQVSLAASTPEAISINRSNPHDLAVLDGDLSPSSLDEIARQLRQQRPGMRILALPPSGSSNRPPFTATGGSPTDPSFNELVRLMDRLIPDKRADSIAASAPPEIQTPAPDKYDLMSRMALALADYGAKAALFYDRVEMVVYPEHLLAEKLEPLTQALALYLQWEDTGDLVRYLDWNTGPSTCLLYATRLLADSGQKPPVAALLFDSQIPLTRARTLVHRFAQSLTGIQARQEEAPVEPQAPPSSEGPHLPEIKPEEASPSGIETAAETASAWIHEEDGSPLRDDLRTDGPTPPGTPDEAPRRAPGKHHTHEDHEASAPFAAVLAQDTPIFAWSLPEDMPAGGGTNLPARVPPVLFLDTNTPQGDPLEPVTTNVYNLSYTGLFIPRLPHHFLARNLADLVGSTFRRICLAYGWRLDALSVRPEYVQWIVRTSPSAAPNTLLKVLRQRSSQVIFESFPDLRRENPAGDFWAPGYLILSGIHSPPADLVREYIRQTRWRQGVLPE